MDESAPATDVEAELRDLRARAYGPHPDIMDDPGALARLAELESAHLAERAIDEPVPAPSGTADNAAGTDSAALLPGIPIATARTGPAALLVPEGTAAPPPSERLARRWRRMTATRGRRMGLIAASLAIMLVIVSAVSWYAAPKPDATLQPSGAVVDREILSLVFAAPLAEVDTSTLTGYEPYRGVEPWVAENAQGARCLMAMERSTDSLANVRCAPPEAELMLDLLVWAPGDAFGYMEGLANGTVIRFQLRGDSVDAFLYVPPSAE
jgi:hypothetical protein